uniref:Secreted protein n=1 Tax=Rhinopithecus roxellana TaxID=61622 RepID=A0A2K6PNF7_RHIRO
MYRWLIRILGTIFCFCDWPVPPARALLKRQHSDSTLFSTVDTDEILAKRPRLDCFIHQDLFCELFVFCVFVQRIHSLTHLQI